MNKDAALQGGVFVQTKRSAALYRQEAEPGLN